MTVPRRSTLTVMLVNGALAAGLAWAVLGPERPLPWLPMGAIGAAPATAAAVPRLVDLAENERAVAWQHPLFSPQREADAAKAGVAPSLDGVLLRGVVIDGQARWALLRLANQRALTLKLGATLDSGWTLSQVSTTTATFQRQGQAQTLNLPVPRLPASAVAPPITLPHVTAP